MSFLQKLRSKAFWCQDFLKGRKTRFHYNEIKLIHENFNSISSIQLRKKNLDVLLKHSVSSTPFYKSYSNFSDLSDFPVIDKLFIKNNFESFKSEIYLNKKNFKAASSGSTGTPFIIYKDLNKKYRNIADIIFFTGLTGFSFGQRLYFMRVWTSLNKKNKLLAWIQNVRMVDVSNLDDNKISEIIDKLKKDKNKIGILSYASNLKAICKYLDKICSKPINCNLSSVIANSECLNEYTKDAFERYFMTPVFSRYSNEECGLLSQQVLGSENLFKINWASYFVEILNFDNDTSVEIGTPGRVVVTDLFNYCMPLIRYDTGDVANFCYDEKGILCFQHVEGRKLDMIYNTIGELISSFVIGGLMKKYTALNQYQFIQESKTDYLFKLNVDNNIFKEVNLLKDEFANVLGANSNIKIEYLNEIPRLASGKHRQVVNNYIRS